MMRVARAVQNGQVPAGALSKAIYRGLDRPQHDRSQQAAAARGHDPIPNYPMTMQGNLAPALKDDIRRAFLELKDPAILKPSASRASRRPTTRPTTSCATPRKCSISTSPS